MITEDLNNIPMPDPTWTYFYEYVDLYKIKTLVDSLLQEMSKHEVENSVVNEKIKKVFKEIRELSEETLDLDEI